MTALAALLVPYVVTKRDVITLASASCTRTGLPAQVATRAALAASDRMDGHSQRVVVIP